MARSAIPIVVVAFACAAIAADPVLPARWGGAADSNMVSSAKDLPADLAAARVLWEVRLGTHQYTIPTIDRGRIYLGIDDAGLERPGVKSTGGGLLLCIDQATAKLIWQLPSPRYMEGVVEPYHFDQWKAGFCSAPVIDGDRVYVVGNRGDVLCLDREGQANGNAGPFVDEIAYMGAKEPGAALSPTDGDIIWRYWMIPGVDAVPHDVCGSTILLYGDLLFVCTSNGQDGKHKAIAHPDAPSLIVLDKRTGALVARETEGIGGRTFHGTWSSPVLSRAGGRDLIPFGGGDGILYAFEPPAADPSGSAPRALKKVWAYDCNPQGYRFQGGEAVPYSRHNKNSPYGPSEIIGSPVIWKGRAYVTIGQSPIHGAGQGNLSCVDIASGEEVWSSRLVDRSLATPSITDEGLLFVADYSGRLHCFDAETGARHWVHEMGAGAWSASAFTADGKVYAGTEGGALWVLAVSKEKRVLARARLDSMPATLTAVDGILYVPTQKKLIAYANGASGSAPRPVPSSE
ncbi:MAG: PQQ-binding-like beta-propeller repeat protein [Planctomycetes bacterium]|nr:PQQ-binding-like beta-propeller repeat protein [Planctomycetota bacterium]